MKIEDVMDTDLLADMLAEGYVRRGDHPTLPLSIYNYTSATQFQQEWNDVTEQCRGLIVDHDGNIIARPFRKFHNYSQVKDSLPDEPFEVFEKMDGSLGVLWEYAGTRGIATRGSFTSDQSKFATKLLNTKYRSWNTLPSVTYLFEIIYPENRIVVDYGDKEDLVLLDAINISYPQSSLDLSRMGWLGPVVGQYSYETLDQLLAAHQTPNAEGYVIRFKSGYRVKVKHDEYVRLHRVLTNVTARRLWEIAARDDLRKKGYTDKEIGFYIGMSEVAVSDIPNFIDILERVPDEFYAWVKETGEKIEMRYREVAVEVQFAYDQAVRYANSQVTPETYDTEFRRAFATGGMDTQWRGLLFSLLDERDISGQIWKAIRPAHEKPFFQQSEDVA